MTQTQTNKGEDEAHYTDGRIPFYDVRTRWLAVCMLDKETIETMHVRENLRQMLRHPNSILNEAIHKAGRETFWPKGTTESFKGQEMHRLEAAFFDLRRAAERILEDKFKHEPDEEPKQSRGWDCDKQYYLELAHMVDDMIMRRGIVIGLQRREAGPDL